MQGIISFFPSLAQVNSFFRRVNVYKNSRSFAHASYVVKMYRVLPKGGTKGLLAPPQRAAVVASFTCINDIWYTCVWHADLQKSQLQWPKPNRKSAILNVVLIAHVLLFIIITKLHFFKMTSSSEPDECCHLKHAEKTLNSITVLWRLWVFKEGHQSNSPQHIHVG